MKRFHLLVILLLTATAMAAPPEETTARVRMAQWLTAQTGQAMIRVLEVCAATVSPITNASLLAAVKAR